MTGRRQRHSRSVSARERSRKPDDGVIPRRARSPRYGGGVIGIIIGLQSRGARARATPAHWASAWFTKLSVFGRIPILLSDDTALSHDGDAARDKSIRLTRDLGSAGGTRRGFFGDEVSAGEYGVDAIRLWGDRLGERR